jgi:hypothetical protein
VEWGAARKSVQRGWIRPSAHWLRVLWCGERRVLLGSVAAEWTKTGNFGIQAEGKKKEVSVSGTRLLSSGISMVKILQWGSAGPGQPRCGEGGGTDDNRDGNGIVLGWV